jgi:MFS family permease
MLLQAGAFAVPVVPKIVNEIVSGGSVTQASVTIYGTLQRQARLSCSVFLSLPRANQKNFARSIDAFFTFFTSFLYASLSDKFGRRPFMILSSLGLGVGFSMVAFARRIWVLMVAAAIDGCTSCMYSQAQAAVSDCVDSEQPEKLGEAFGVFQGLAIGVAFMIGLPLGGKKCCSLKCSGCALCLTFASDQAFWASSRGCVSHSALALGYVW